MKGQLIQQKKLQEIKNLVIQGQNVTHDLLYAGFAGLAFQNQQLIEDNQNLKKQLHEMQEQFQAIANELQQIQNENQKKEARRKAYNNRKILPKRDPVTPEIYQALIDATEANLTRYNGYTAARLRIALCLLTITGIRVNELLPLKVHQLKTLLTEGWIAIDRSKRGPASHKAYLSKQGKQILKSRQKDFDLLYLLKEDKSYIFTSQLDHNKHIRREQITKDINKIMALVSKNLPDQPNLKSHSFRTSFITQLWKDTNDIEFVRQVIGHSKLDTTSSYVQDLSEKERQERMSEV